MQERVLLTTQEAMEPMLNETLKNEKSLKAFKSTLALPQHSVEKHEHV